MSFNNFMVSLKRIFLYFGMRVREQLDFSQLPRINKLVESIIYLKKEFTRIFPSILLFCAVYLLFTFTLLSFILFFLQGLALFNALYSALSLTLFNFYMDFLFALSVFALTASFFAGMFVLGAVFHLIINIFKILKTTVFEIIPEILFSKGYFLYYELTKNQEILDFTKIQKIIQTFPTLSEDEKNLLINNIHLYIHKLNQLPNEQREEFLEYAHQQINEQFKNQLLNGFSSSSSNDLYSWSNESLKAHAKVKQILMSLRNEPKIDVTTKPFQSIFQLENLNINSRNEEVKNICKEALRFAHPDKINIINLPEKVTELTNLSRNIIVIKDGISR
jgi:hypothetical protein